ARRGDAGIRFEHLLRVARTKRRRPLVQTILARRGALLIATAARSRTTTGALPTGRITARTARRRLRLEIHEARTHRVPFDVALAGVGSRAALTAPSPEPTAVRRVSGVAFTQ